MNHSAYTVSFLQNSIKVARQLQEQRDKIGKIIDVWLDAWKHQRNVFVLGNGGSSSTATHFAADLAKTVVSDPSQEGIRALSFDNIPLASALTNDWGWDRLFDWPLRTYWTPQSVVIGISVHGGAGKDRVGAWSQNIMRAFAFAKERGGTTIGLAGFDGGAMKDAADICVIVPANSTPQVESFHVLLHHLITFRLKELIESKVRARGGKR